MPVGVRTLGSAPEIVKDRRCNRHGSEGVINLADIRSHRDERERKRTRPRDAKRVEFYFDLASPFTYLAAERVDRAFADVLWIPASGAVVRPEGDADRQLAGARAAELRLPLVWPERWPGEVPAAMRAAGYASEQGRGAAFVLAAGRLAFCGGFDLDDPEILAEAAAAAGISLEGCLEAAGELHRDGPIEAVGRRLLAVGADRLPALRVGRSLFWGEHRVAEAAAAARHQAALRAARA